MDKAALRSWEDAAENVPLTPRKCLGYERVYLPWLMASFFFSEFRECCLNLLDKRNLWSYIWFHKTMPLKTQVPRWLERLCRKTHPLVLLKGLISGVFPHLGHPSESLPSVWAMGQLLNSEEELETIVTQGIEQSFSLNLEIKYS